MEASCFSLLAKMQCLGWQGVAALVSFVVHLPRGDRAFARAWQEVELAIILGFAPINTNGSGNP